VRTYLEKNPSQKRDGKWLKVKALSSNPSTTKKKKKERKSRNGPEVWLKQ
jgi:hypothetical protein